MPVTQTAFLDAYRAQLVKLFPWAQDTTELDRLVESARATIGSADVCTWTRDSDVVVAAWRKIGGKGEPTLRALRALPEA